MSADSVTWHLAKFVTGGRPRVRVGITLEFDGGGVKDARRGIAIPSSSKFHTVEVAAGTPLELGSALRALGYVVIEACHGD